MVIDARLPVRLTVLWLIEDRPEHGRVEAVVAFLEETAKAFSKRMPHTYSNAMTLRLVAPAHGDALPDAAEDDLKDLPVTMMSARTAALAAQCDLVVAPRSQDPADVGRTPVLIFEAAQRSFALQTTIVDFLRPDRSSPAPPIVATPAIVADALMKPPRGRQARKLDEYLAEQDDGRIGRHSYGALLFLFGARPAGPDDVSVDKGWDRALATARRVQPGAVDAIEALRAAYLRADAQANAYGQRWRSTLVARSVLLAFASIVSGFTGVLFSSLTIVTIPIQMVSTGLVFFDRRYAASHRWREKWLEYRRLAERFRVDRFLALAGIVRSKTVDDDWTDWLALETHRSAAPVADVSDTAAPEIIEHLLSCELDSQISYHRNAFRRSRLLDRRVGRAATTVLVGMFGVGVSLALAATFWHGAHTISLGAAISLALSAAPSIYATVNGVRRDLDVARQGKRSARIATDLKKLSRAIGAAPKTPEVARVGALRAAGVMGGDVLRWKNVVELI